MESRSVSHGDRQAANVGKSTHNATRSGGADGRHWRSTIEPNVDVWLWMMRGWKSAGSKRVSGLDDLCRYRVTVRRASKG
jgi:hypothetical protein